MLTSYEKGIPRIEYRCPFGVDLLAGPQKLHSEPLVRSNLEVSGWGSASSPQSVSVLGANLPLAWGDDDTVGREEQKLVD